MRMTSLVLIITCFRLVFTACADGKVRAYDAKSGALRKVFVGHSAAVNTIAVKGKRIFSGDSEGALIEWDAAELM